MIIEALLFVVKLTPEAICGALWICIFRPVIPNPPFPPFLFYYSLLSSVIGEFYLLFIHSLHLTLYNVVLLQSERDERYCLIFAQLEVDLLVSLISG